MNLDKNAGYLVVTDSNEVLSLLETYIGQMNQLMMRQITLEVEVVTVDLNEAHAAGIDWQAVSNLNIGSFTYLTPPAPATAGTPFSIEFAGINGKSALVRALQTFGQVSSAYSGVVVTSNRTPAPISVNNTISYVRQTSPAMVSSSQVGAVAASSGLTPGQITTGTNIVLLPMILESNQVLMQCLVSISSLKELTRFDSGSGASQQSVQLPNVDTFTMVQRMAIPSGKTMVVMGYDQARTGTNTNGPYGQLVTGKSGNGNKQSIVIMITPRISDI
jgi:type IVB pilus formation R64 PilN family outer membrane protein